MLTSIKSNIIYHWF